MEGDANGDEDVILMPMYILIPLHICKHGYIMGMFMISDNSSWNRTREEEEKEAEEEEEEEEQEKRLAHLFVPTEYT